MASAQRVQGPSFLQRLFGCCFGQPEPTYVPQENDQPWFQNMMREADRRHMLLPDGMLPEQFWREPRGQLLPPNAPQNPQAQHDILLRDFATWANANRAHPFADSLDTLTQSPHDGGLPESLLCVQSDTPRVSGRWHPATGHTYWVHECILRGQNIVCPWNNTTLRHHQFVAQHEFDALFTAAFPTATEEAQQNFRTAQTQAQQRAQADAVDRAAREAAQNRRIVPQDELAFINQVQQGAQRGESVDAIANALHVDPDTVAAVLGVPHQPVQHVHHDAIIDRALNMLGNGLDSGTIADIIANQFHITAADVIILLSQESII